MIPGRELSRCTTPMASLDLTQLMAEEEDQVELDEFNR